MDANKVWQWRIMHVKKYSRHPQPFYHSNRIGLDFNVASSTKEKKDLQLVTNAVILEVCDFAKTVNKGKSHFLTNILENNFDLGLENEQQRIDFTTQIHYKVRELIRKPPEDRNEVFTLFDTSKPECNSNNGLTKASTERKTERFTMEMDDTGDSEQEDEFMCSQEPSNGNIKTECLFDEMGGAPDEDREHEDELRVSASLSTEELKEDFLTTPFPYCEEIGLNFDVVSKQRLDPDLLTKGVMLELEHVTRILTASYSPIVLGVLEHNFDLDLKSQRRRNRVWFKISQLLRRRNQLITTVRKMRLDFENEPYSFQTVPFKKALCRTGALRYHFKEVTQGRQPDFRSKQKKRALFTTDERVNKRCRKGQSEDMETNSLSHHTGSCTSQTAEWDYDESCPFGESDDDSERVTNQSPKNCSLTSDILRQSESSCLGTEAPLLILNDISSSLPAVNSSLNTSASQPNKKGLHGGEEQTQTPRNEPNDCNTEQEAASKTAEWDCFYSCPLAKSNYHPDTVINPVDPGDQDHFQSPKNSLTSDFLRQSEPSCLGIGAPFSILSDIFSSLSAVNSNVNTSANQPDKKGYCSGEEPTQTSRNEPNDCNIEQEETSKTAKWDCYDSCPHAKSDYDPDTVINPVNAGYQDHFQSPKNCSLTSDFLRQSESSCLGIGAPFLILNDIFSSFLAVNSNVNTSASQPVKKGHCGDEEPTQTPRNEPNESEFEQEETSETAEWDYFDSCPKSDYDPDTVINPADTGNQDHFQSPKNSSLNSDFAIESNSSCLVIHAPSMISTDMKSISQTVNSDVNPPFASQHDQKVLCGGREKTQTPRNTANECDMEQGKIGTQMMWKLRANRVKQILSEFGPFVWSNRVGLEFNVGFGPKQNIGFDPAFECALPEVAKFALAMNSSQQNFIMEILEYNFNFYFPSEHQRKDFMCNIMDTVRQLKNCQDGVKCSKEIFDLPFLLTIQNQKVQTESSVKLDFSDVYRTEECDVEEIFNLPSLLIACDQELQTSVNPELSNVSRLGECNGDPISLANIQEQPTIVDSYPFCKEIGLRLYVNQHHQNKKLDINKLTNGAMTEVINFAEKLCGTFEQICLGILRHNLDLDMQSEDSDLARNIFEQIPAIVQRKNLVICTKAYRKIRHRRQSNMKKAEQDIQNNQNVDAHSAVNSLDFPDIENQQELSLFLWKLRANHIQQILSIPHGEQCPLYPYSRCKKLGIEFNVGASIKQNLDTKLLTNGIMVEICYFATSLLLAQKYFMSEILEYNFHVNFHNELYRNDFAQKIYQKIRAAITKMKSSPTRRKMAFELPDMRFMNETDSEKAIHCPKCYQERDHKIYEEETGQGHMHHHRPHTMTNKVSADADYPAQKPAKVSTSTFTAIEEMIMDRYPLCKKMGLNLCVNKDQPKDALEVRELTFGIMFEVAHFTRVLCSTKNKIINTVLQHNFNIGTERHDIDIFKLFGRARAHEDGGVVWFSEVFAPESIVFKHYEPAMKQNRSAVMQISETKKTVKKRQLALQTKKERATLKSYSNSDTELEEIGTKSNYTCPLGESDLDSDEIADLEKFGDHNHLQNPKSCSLSSYILRESKSSCLGIREPFVILTDIRSSLAALNSNVNTSASQPEKNKLFSGEEQTPTSGNELNECDTEQEEAGRENNMWKLRANRVKQILSEFGPFHWSERVGLKFNVGFDPNKNIGVDPFQLHLLSEIAKFALAMNSSQQNFIMEILEYNFDLYFQSQRQRNTCMWKIMDTVRQLKDCADAVKFSKEIFDLPSLLTAQDQKLLSVGSVSPELSSISTTEDNGLAFTCHPDSDAETKEHVLPTIVHPYPYCKEIGLRLHVNQRKQNKKLDINKLTKGAMTEITNFAEELCGTFEQICLDIIRHNLDLNLQRGDSDLAQNLVDQIPVVMERKNISRCAQAFKKIQTRHNKTIEDFSTNGTLDCKDVQNLDACIAGSSQAPVIDLNVGSSPNTGYKKELNLFLWKLRATQIQEILSIPHVEHCPLYFYSRCKKLGIDFNVASGIKQNLDPKLLTNGIMVEICIFATELLSTQKNFVTEILEFNFHLNLHNELYRSAYAQQIWPKIKSLSTTKMNRHFTLPESLQKCLQKASLDKVTTVWCPKCYQERKQKLCQDEAVPGRTHEPHPHNMINEVSADGNCQTQKPAKDQSSTFAAIEEMIMHSYPLCKKMGLTLCVNKDKPKEKPNLNELTYGTMSEVAKFAKEMCSPKSKIIHAVLEHNFNISMQGKNIDVGQLLHRAFVQKDGRHAWFSEVFDTESCYKQIEPTSKQGIKSNQIKSTSVDIAPSIQPCSPKSLTEQHMASMISAVQLYERKETIKKRKLALQSKEENITLLSHSTSVVKVKRNRPSQAQLNSYPICKEIGLDLDVTSKSGEKQKLDLNLLTRAVVCEIHKFASKKMGHYLPHTVFDILDYNFDLSSQDYRRWEFSIAVSSKVISMVKQRQVNRNRPDEVFQLPFVFPPKERRKKKPRKCSGEKKNKITNEGSVCQVNCHSDVSHVHFLDGVQTNNGNVSHDEDTMSATDPGTVVPIRGSQVSGGCDVPLQENIQIKEEYDPHYGNVKQEPDTEEKYHPHCDDVKTESTTEDVTHVVPAVPTGPFVYPSIIWPNCEKTQPETVNQYLQYYVVAEPQGSAVDSNTATNIKTEWDTDGVHHFKPVEPAGSHEYYIVTTDQSKEGTWIREEQEHEPGDLHHDGVHRK